MKYFFFISLVVLSFTLNAQVQKSIPVDSVKKMYHEKFIGTTSGYTYVAQGYGNPKYIKIKKLITQLPNSPELQNDWIKTKKKIDWLNASLRISYLSVAGVLIVAGLQGTLPMALPFIIIGALAVTLFLIWTYKCIPKVKKLVDKTNEYFIDEKGK
jgi:hypothetical protein